AVYRGGGELGPVRGVEFGEDVREVRLHRAAAHQEAGTDLRIGQALGDEADDVDLGRCEAGPAGGRAAPAAAGPAGVLDALVEGEPRALGCRPVERGRPERSTEVGGGAVGGPLQ